MQYSGKQVAASTAGSGGGRPQRHGTGRRLQPHSTFLNRQMQTFFIQSPWTGSSHSTGFGGREPGTWSPGVYRAEFFVAGQKVAEGPFEIF